MIGFACQSRSTRLNVRELIMHASNDAQQQLVTPRFYVIVLNIVRHGFLIAKRYEELTRISSVRRISFFFSFTSLSKLRLTANRTPYALFIECLSRCAR